MTIYNKKTYEELARLNFELLFPQYHFECTDKPDLQDTHNNIGIEVTSSTPTEIRERTAYGERFLGKEITREEEEKFRGTFLHLDNTRRVDGYSARELLYTSQFVNEIDDVLKKKCQKSNDYKQFLLNGVYIFTGTNLVNSEDANTLLTHKIVKHFDFVILDSFGKIHFLINDTVFIINIDDESQHKNNEEAIRLSR